MLIEFSISNFRSFREKQTFSMVAAPRLRKKENVFKPSVPGEDIPALLKVAAIYGPNASGKSNLLKAMRLVSDIANISPSAASEPLPVSPFRFDKELEDKPTEIEIHFISRKMRYEFNLSLTQDRIIEEKLTEYPRGKETVLYHRKHLDSLDEYTFSSQLEGGDAIHTIWKQLTAPKTLFISQAVANSSEELQQLRVPFDWLSKGIAFVSEGLNTAWARNSQKLAKDFPRLAEELSDFLHYVDVPVINISFDGDSDGDNEDENNKKTIADLHNKPTKSAQATFTHRTLLGEANFRFHEESEGTKNLIGFWLPWSLKESQFISDLPIALVVDEFDSSLHPEIVAHLIKKHINAESYSQLIFTTHDTHLMNTKLLRRDQFWITERDGNGATKLRSIYEYKGREGEDIEKRYYENRYRGLPFLKG